MNGFCTLIACLWVSTPHWAVWLQADRMFTYHSVLSVSYSPRCEWATVDASLFSLAYILPFTQPIYSFLLPLQLFSHFLTLGIALGDLNSSVYNTPGPDASYLNQDIKQHRSLWQK